MEKSKIWLIYGGEVTECIGVEFSKEGADLMTSAHPARYYKSFYITPEEKPETPPPPALREIKEDRRPFQTTPPDIPIKFSYRFRIVTITQGCIQTFVAQRKVLGLFWWDVSAPQLSEQGALLNLDEYKFKTKYGNKSYKYLD